MIIFRNDALTNIRILNQISPETLPSLIKESLTEDTLSAIVTAIAAYCIIDQCGELAFRYFAIYSYYKVIYFQ